MVFPRIFLKIQKPKENTTEFSIRLTSKLYNTDARLESGPLQRLRLPSRTAESGSSLNILTLLLIIALPRN
jgi:hypothetical protein